MRKTILAALICASVISAQKVDWKQIKNKPTFVSSDYEWARTNGVGLSGDLSSAGAKTITFTGCPLGVAGTNANHYIRIAGGTGVAEQVLITGGTCTSGAASGTLTFTTSNTHTGAWVAATATAGVQEAVWAAGELGTVEVPSGRHTVYSSVYVQTVAGVQTQRVSIRGVNRASSVLVADATFSGPDAGFLFSDDDDGTGKYDTALYGLAELTLDFRNVTTYDIVQVGTATAIGLGNGTSFRELNFWGGKRYFYSLTGGKGWLTDCTFDKATSATDGIYFDVTTQTVPRGGWTLARLEVGTEAPAAGSGNGVHIVCTATDAAKCNWTHLLMVEILGRWASSLRVEATEMDASPYGAGMYVTVDKLVTEAFTGTHALYFRNASYSQVRNSWISNFTASGTDAAVYMTNCTEMMFVGNYIYTATTGAHVQIEKGSRHMYEANRFIGNTPAFGFGATGPTTSTVGFNHYNNVVYATADAAKWIEFSATAAGNTLPILTPFQVDFKGPGAAPVVLKNITAVAGKKKNFFVDENGHFQITNDASDAYIFTLTDAGVLKGGSKAFADLAGLPGAAPGVWIFCTDCDTPVPAGAICSSSGDKAGAMAFVLRGFWRCF